MSGAIGGLIAVLLLTLLSRSAAAKSTNGSLHYGAFPRGLGIVIALAVVGMLYVLLFTDPRETGALVCLIVGFGVMAVFALGDAFGVGGRFDAEGIDFKTPWTGRKVQKWSDLREIRFNQSMKWYVFSFADGTKIRMSNLLVGHGPLLGQLRALGHEVR